MSLTVAGICMGDLSPLQAGGLVLCVSVQLLIQPGMGYGTTLTPLFVLMAACPPRLCRVAFGTRLKGCLQPLPPPPG